MTVSVRPDSSRQNALQGIVFSKYEYMTRVISFLVGDERDEGALMCVSVAMRTFLQIAQFKKKIATDPRDRGMPSMKLRANLHSELVKKGCYESEGEQFEWARKLIFCYFPGVDGDDAKNLDDQIFHRNLYELLVNMLDRGNMDGANICATCVRKLDQGEIAHEARRDGFYWGGHGLLYNWGHQNIIRSYYKDVTGKGPMRNEEAPLANYLECFPELYQDIEFMKMVVSVCVSRGFRDLGQKIAERDRSSDPFDRLWLGHYSPGEEYGTEEEIEQRLKGAFSQEKAKGILFRSSIASLRVDEARFYGEKYQLEEMNRFEELVEERMQQFKQKYSTNPPSEYYVRRLMENTQLDKEDLGRKLYNHIKTLDISPERLKGFAKICGQEEPVEGAIKIQQSVAGDSQEEEPRFGARRPSYNRGIPSSSTEGAWYKRSWILLSGALSMGAALVVSALFIRRAYKKAIPLSKSP